MPTYYSNIAADTTLNGGITNVATTLTVVSSTSYPSTPFNIEIGTEVIRVGAVAGLVFSSLTRGYDGTTAAAHSDTDPVTHVVIAEDVTSKMYSVNTGELFAVSGSAYAWKGAAVIPHFDIKIWGIIFFGTVINAATYQGAVITGGATVATIEKGTSITASANQAETQHGTLLLPFDNPIPLTAGTEYFLMYGRTDSTDTYALLCQYPAADRYQFPFGAVGTNASARIAKASPAVADTINYFTGAPTRTGALWSMP